MFTSFDRKHFPRWLQCGSVLWYCSFPPKLHSRYYLRLLLDIQLNGHFNRFIHGFGAMERVREREEKYQIQPLKIESIRSSLRIIILNGHIIHHSHSMKMDGFILTFLWLTSFISLNSLYARLACVTFWNGLDSFLMATFCWVTVSYAALKRDKSKIPLINDQSLGAASPFIFKANLFQPK